MASPRRFLLRVHPEVERGSVDSCRGQETPRGSRPSGEPQTPAVPAVPIFPRARHSSARGGGGEEVRALPAAQLNSGGPYYDAPPPSLRPGKGRKLRSWKPRVCLIGTHIRKGRGRWENLEFLKASGAPKTIEARSRSRGGPQTLLGRLDLLHSRRTSRVCRPAPDLLACW